MGFFSVYEFCPLSVATLGAFSAEELRSRIPKADVAHGSLLGAVQWIPFVAVVIYHLLLCLASAGFFSCSLVYAYLMFLIKLSEQT